MFGLQETSESPHLLSGSGGGGSGSPLDQGGPMYPCMYCGATFPHQSKLTRHILSHSLETLKFRETAHLLHPSHMASLLPPDLPPLPQHFAHRQIPPPLEPLEPPDGGPMDIKFAAAAAVAAAANMSESNISGSGGGGASSSGSINVSGSSMIGGSSNTVIGSMSMSSSSSSLATTSAGIGGSSSTDPNSVVLCKFCGKSFPDVASLITHLPVHTGDRPFKCEFCGKAFKLRHHMKDHCRVHTGKFKNIILYIQLYLILLYMYKNENDIFLGERPFRCGMCGKTFSRSTILKAHEKTHFPKYVRKFLSPSPVDTKDELPQ